jgi:hypothetical protein
LTNSQPWEIGSREIDLDEVASFTSIISFNDREADYVVKSPKLKLREILISESMSEIGIFRQSCGF